jgi:CDP-4-dehydro-6-deoxyglucose reductase, E1
MKKFVAGKTYIPVGMKVYNDDEINAAIKVAKEGWWTAGKYVKKFEYKFAQLLGVDYAILTNSGSSANLLALAALTSKEFGKKALKPGDEFITTAACFPTTINPGIIYGLKPVFIDINLNTLNIDARQIEKAISPRTKLILLAHSMGIPFDFERIMYLKKKYNLWMIADCCDALGSKYDDELCGTFGDISTFSFYASHHMTMGEGGAIITNNYEIMKAIRQFRDWGRDCWCGTGEDNCCGKRFSWQMGELPYGYDHKYTYSQIGYNLKTTDFGAAIGLVQLKKLSSFSKKRRKNYLRLKKVFEKLDKYFDLVKINEKSDPAWFGFPAIVKENAPFTRNELMQYLEKKLIASRTLFTGNILKHPAYVDIKSEFKIVGKMKNCDIVMERALWVGCHQGMGSREIEYIGKILKEFLHNKK